MESLQSKITGKPEQSPLLKLLQSVYNLNFKGRKNHPDFVKHSNTFGNITYFPNGADFEVFGVVYQIKWETWHTNDESLINLSLPIARYPSIEENLTEITRSYLASIE